MSGPVCRFRFGRFELVAHTGELFADGRRVPLAHQSFVLLRLLLERGGDVVSRDDVRHALWPDGTHVDYDHGLNNAAARLRRALGDTPAAPRIFETLPRVGYRLLVPVVAIDVGTVPSVPGPGQPAGRWSIGGWRAAVVAAGVFAAGAGSGVLWSLRPVAAVPSPASVTAEARDQAERSLAYTRLVLAGDLAAGVAYEPAGDAATRALALDPTLAHAQVSAGYVAMWGRWDWAAADRFFRTALTRDPSSARAHEAHARWLSARGRHAEALAAIELARDLDRASIDITREAARLAFLAGRVDTAIDRLNTLLASQPDDAPSHELLSLALASQGLNQAAADHLQQFLVLIGIDRQFATVDARVLAERGLGGLTRWHLSRPSGKSADRHGVPFKMASSHALVGDVDQALDWLERARDQRDSRLLFVNVDPRFAGLRDDPRFRRLVEDVGL